MGSEGSVDSVGTLETLGPGVPTLFSVGSVGSVGTIGSGATSDGAGRSVGATDASSDFVGSVLLVYGPISVRSSGASIPRIDLAAKNCFSVVTGVVFAAKSISAAEGVNRRVALVNSSKSAPS